MLRGHRIPGWLIWFAWLVAKWTCFGIHAQKNWFDILAFKAFVKLLLECDSSLLFSFVNEEYIEWNLLNDNNYMCVCVCLCHHNERRKKNTPKSICAQTDYDNGMQLWVMTVFSIRCNELIIWLIRWFPMCVAVHFNKRFNCRHMLPKKMFTFYCNDSKWMQTNEWGGKKGMLFKPCENEWQ